ncbi:hypothetical protein [uncultured Draconibacterium sp.]|uniref:hypothetical protein n=1 Tax=uncultured Draconibacterium sp. TaxID=1573823 RepID=UPI0032612F9A
MTSLEKRKKAFIAWSIIILFILLISSYLNSTLFDTSDKISSILPEVNGIQECIDLIKEKDSLNINAVDSLLLNAKYQKEKVFTDSTIFIKQTQQIKQNSKKQTGNTISKLVERIETKVDRYEAEKEDSNKNEWWKIIFSWQFVVIYTIVALVYFNTSISDFYGLFGKVKSINILGNSIEFGEEAKVNTEFSIKQYRKRIKEMFSYQIQKEQLNDKIRYVVDELRTQLIQTKNDGKSDEEKIPNANIRCTIHIKDILFQETLYQLLDYYPITKSGGSGRIKSIRFGIIGLAWRMEESKIRGNIDNSQNQLIRDWGLDKSESTSDSNTKSFAAIVLKANDGTRLGVIYFDSTVGNLFGDLTHNDLKSEAEMFENMVIEKCKEKGIFQSLLNIQKNFADKFLQIDIYEK